MRRTVAVLARLPPGLPLSFAACISRANASTETLAGTHTTCLVADRRLREPPGPSDLHYHTSGGTRGYRDGSPQVER